MSGFTGVAIGDLHLDALTKYWPNANRMQLDSVRGVVDHARRKGATEVVFLGDVAEGIRDNTGNAMRLSEPAQCELLALLLELDGVINTHVILGNHDWASEGSHSLQMFMELQRHEVFKRTRFYAAEERVKIGGVRCALLPYPCKEPPSNTQLAFAHYEVSGAAGDNGRVVHSEHEHRYGCPFIQGHLHTHQRVRRHHYPGTLYQKSFGENEDKGFAMFSHSGSTFDYAWQEHGVPFTLRNLRINTREDFKQLTKDPLIMYKLFIHQDVRVPDNLLTSYPNVVNRLAYATEEEAAVLEHEEFLTENQRIDLDSRVVLPDYLKSKGATRTQIERGMQIFDDYHQQQHPPQRV